MSRRRGLLWFYGECEIVPWFMGFVERYELGARFTLIPLNIPAAWWLWLLKFVRWHAVRPTERWVSGRRALRQAFERGRTMGKLQGRAGLLCSPEYHEEINRQVRRQLALERLAQEAYRGLRG